jgi:hypothetical protein
MLAFYMSTYLVYFTATWYIMWPFGTFLFGIFFPFWYVVPRKNLATLAFFRIYGVHCATISATVESFRECSARKLITFGTKIWSQSYKY